MGKSVAEAILLLLPVILFLIILLDTGVCQPDPCPPSKKCSRHGPEIRFPFRLKKKEEDNQHCRAYPGFDLSCNGTNTVLNLPYSAELFVTDINYKEQRLSVSDPQNCIEGLLLNLKLNLSASIFNYRQYSYNYTFVNCSSDVNFDESPIPCLSGSQYTVYLVPDYREVDKLPFSCQRIKTVEYFTGSFWWGVPRCSDCETRGERCGFKNITGEEITCFNIPPPPPPKGIVLLSTQRDKAF